MCILQLCENGLENYRLAKKWELFKIVLLYMDHPVSSVQSHTESFMYIQMCFQRGRNCPGPTCQIEYVMSIVYISAKQMEF